MPPESGCLIAFEGTEGAGKSTQVKRAAQALRRDGHRVEITSEPGATELGQRLRELLLHARDAEPVPLAELFLYLADRAQHVAQMIAPALSAGAVVLTDRFSASTIAYQGYGRGLPLESVRALDASARRGLAPALTVLLDCPVADGLARARGRSTPGDRFEREATAFHERVRAGFLELAGGEPGRFLVVDATAPIAAVQARVAAEVERRLGRAI